MLKTVLIIFLSVLIFGIFIFILVKKTLENRLKYYLSKNKKRLK